MADKQVKIINQKGLHARAAAKLVEVAEGFDARATIIFDGQSADADSIMGLLMLAASNGSTIDVKTSGSDAEPLAQAIEDLISNRFGEDM